MKVAIAQTSSGTDKEENFADFKRFAESAAANGADLLVLPEFASWEEFTPSEAVVETAESLDGPFASRVKALAKENNVAIAYGFNELIPGADKVYNTVLVVGKDGEEITHYRKIHLYDAFGYKESDKVVPGDVDGLTTFELEGVKVGVLTCYDIRFPEPVRLYADQGVQLLILPASWVPGPRKENHWKTLVTARAIENTIYVAGVGQAPKIGTGGSLVADPAGVVKVELGETKEIGFAEIHPDRIDSVRVTNPSLANRRFTVVAK